MPLYDIRKRFIKMPQCEFMCKSLKNICVDTVLFFALFTLVGHLSINFWERYTIKNELSTMKHSLITLKDTESMKDDLDVDRERRALAVRCTCLSEGSHAVQDTITKIGKAYDNLQTELRDLFRLVDKKQSKMAPQCAQQTDTETMGCKNKYNLDRRKLHEKEILTKPKMTFNVGTMTDKDIESSAHQNKSTEPISKEVATNTKNRPKSTGITSNMSYETNLQNDSTCTPEYHNHLRCYRDFDHCRRMCVHKVEV